MILFEDFKKLDIQIGTITSAENVEGSDKLIKLQVDFGSLAEVLPDGKTSEDKKQRQIIAGIGRQYTSEQLIGKQCPFVVNLEPKVVMGLESNGMMLCADNEGPVILNPEKEVISGSKIR